MRGRKTSETISTRISVVFLFRHEQESDGVTHEMKMRVQNEERENADQNQPRRGETPRPQHQAGGECRANNLAADQHPAGVVFFLFGLGVVRSMDRYRDAEKHGVKRSAKNRV